MPAAPTNPLTATAKAATKCVTLLGPEDGTEPLPEHEEPTYVPIIISRSAGGRSLDYATFAIDLGRREERLVDMRVPSEWNRQVIVTRPDADDVDVGIFWGMLAAQSITISDRNESAMATARIDPHLFGGPLTGMRVRDPRTGDMVRLDMDVVFNPLVDGVIVANRSTHLDPDGNFYVWVHPESVRTDDAETYQEETDRQSWTLAGMVFSMCWLLNPNEEHIKNPTREELTAAIVDQDPPEVSNLWLRRGDYLPAYLDMILEPHGFGWFDKIGYGDGGETTRKISVFKRGEGEKKDVYLQRPEETSPELDLAETNVADLQHDISVADLANVVYGYGGLQEREVTVELYRGWPATDDDLACEELDKTVTAEDGSVYLTHPNVHRLWVANEAGEWTNTRTEITDPLDMASVFDLWTARRRRIDDCLQRDVMNRRIPPVLQLYNPEEQIEGEPEIWTDVRPGTYSVLTDQIGVMFNGATPPDDIVMAGTGARLRITGTLTGDSRLFREATRREASPNGKEIVLYLDVADRFQDRQVQTSGSFASVIHDNALYGEDTRDDGDDLQGYVDSARDVEDAANVDAAIRLHGLHWDYEIGDMVRKVAGREISFDRLSLGQEGTRYLQIVRIDHDIQRQSTTLYVRLNQDEGYQRDAMFGGPVGKKLRIV